MLKIKEKFDSLMASINKFQRDEYFNRLLDENKRTVSKMVFELFYNADDKSYKLDSLLFKFKKELKMTKNEFDEFERHLKEHLKEIQNVLFELSENGVEFRLKRLRGKIVWTFVLGATVLGNITLAYFLGPLALVFLPVSVLWFGSKLKCFLKQIKENKKIEKSFGDLLTNNRDLETHSNEEIPLPPPELPAPPKIISIPSHLPKSEKVSQTNKSKEEELMDAIKKLRSKLPEYLTDEQKEKYSALTSRAERNDYLLKIKAQHDMEEMEKAITETKMIASREKVLENKGTAPEDAPEEIKEKWSAMSFQERMEIVSEYSTKITTPDPDKVPVPENISEEDKKKWGSLSWLERAEMWCRYDSYGSKPNDKSK